MGHRDRLAHFFSVTNGVPPYLARWHQAFAPRPGSAGPRVELWFDRGDAPPRCEAAQLPPHPDATVLRLAALYLAAIINNTLCVWGARRVHLVVDDEALGRELLHRVSGLLLYRAELFSDLTLLFIFALMEQRYGERFVIDADKAQAARLAARAVRAPERPLPQPPDKRTVLALNIGQYKTSAALVRLDGAGGFVLSRRQRTRTWPEDGRLRCYASLADQAIGSMAAQLGQLPPDVEAVCVSIANPVWDGEPRGVARVGLCATCDQPQADDLGPALRRAIIRHFPALPVFVVNDAVAQGLFASRFCRQEPAPPTPGYATHLLSVRFGACPSISYIDAFGRNIDRLNEYPWLVTTVHGDRQGEAQCATISRYLSFYGFGSIAEELGLLAKYGVDQAEAASVFYALYTEGNEAQWRDAVKIYRVLGAHIAMLAYEIQRHTPVHHVQLLGSEANHLDAMVFPGIWDGFAAFIDRHALLFEHVDFTLAEATSARASLVGAAVAYGDQQET